jgi:4-hydroxybenzoate polyprenyltransferase
MPSEEYRPTPLAAGVLNSLRLYGRLMRLDRPVGTWLLLWPALWGLWVAAEGQPQPLILVVMVLGVIVMRAAGCVINDFADRNLDSHVARTRDRPLATGEVTATEALALFIVLSLLAVALVLTLNPLTQTLAVVGGLLTVIYPFTKRFLSAPQVVLGAAFGWSIPMAFAAETGSVPRLAWLMWLSVIVWALIYDTMYAMADRADDLRIGVKSTAILFGSADVVIVSVLMITLILALALVGRVGELGPWYFASLAVAGLLLLRQRALIATRDPARCFKAFLESHLVGAAVFAGIALDYFFR